jgi:O-antigen/teichoic acid export membrane protein
VLSRLPRDALVYGGATLLSRGVQLVLIPIYTRALAPDEYGVLEMILVVAALANVAVALEISQGVARQLPEAGEPASRRAYASTAVLFTAAMWALFATAVALVAEPLSTGLIGTAAWAGVLRVAAVALAANAVFILLQDLLRWRLRPWAYAVASLVSTAVSATLGVYLVTQLQLGVAGIFWGHLAGAVAGTALAGPLLGDNLARVFDRTRLAQMLIYSAPLVVSSAATFANLYVDRIAISALMGLDVLGVYAVGARFASVVPLLAIGLQAALTPLVFQSHRDPATPRAIARAFRVYCATAVTLLAGLALFATELLRFLTAPAYHAAWSVLPILAAAGFFATLYSFAPGLFLERRTALVAAINIGAALLNLALNLVLVERLGIIGAAVSACVASATAFAGFLVLGQALYHVPHNWLRLTLGTLVGAASIAVGWALNATEPVAGAGTETLKSILLIGTALASIATFLDPGDLHAAGRWFLRRKGVRPGLGC